ncbi:hypothetical protein DAT35_41155 [Vitiosangium sp. GDMCC 1.1324]|nr:hypothetical protein DAT35_41155 [Vitiosangium sp. GDMCC 1.1324]
MLKQQASVSDAIKRAQADGFISAKEQADIQRQQAKASASIREARTSFEFDSILQDHGVVQTQAEQLGSIAQGIRSGQLSSSESSTLLRGQADLTGDIAKAQADGSLSPAEKLATTARQAKAGLDIQREKHDLEKAPHGRNRFPIIFY